ncbi:hypothetical protein O181_022583 [Austropuccinia psidii MF-1]|uniref:Uncharacterized protein n=1 Tax=Austropuccinia psidii MF-1 TaxID=1389203 RepID=A0A9Q3CFG3_9BASI|nr:hypothetical protein [Austropuccinia psidii MF-1]
MPVQNSPPASQKKFQARTKAVLTTTLKDPLDITPSVPQLRANLDRGPIWKEGRGPRRSSLFSGVAGSFPGISTTLPRGLGKGNSEEEEESDSTEPAPAAVGEFQVPGGPTLAQSIIYLSFISLNNLYWKLCKKLLELWPIFKLLNLCNLQAASRPPAFNTPYMTAPDYFNWNVPFKVRSFIQSCKLIFHNEKANSSQDRKQLLKFHFISHWQG